MGESQTLLPCPHCGSDEGVYPAHHWPGGGEPYAIDCIRCGYDFTPREGMDVVALWNRRASDVEGSQTCSRASAEGDERRSRTRTGKNNKSTLKNSKAQTQ